MSILVGSLEDPKGQAHPVGQAGCFVVLFVVISGCAETSRCVPGASASCACPGGATGAQVCRDDSTYGPCRCVDTNEEPADAGITDAGVDGGVGEPDAGCTDPIENCGFGDLFCSDGACIVDPRPICRACTAETALDVCGHPLLCVGDACAVDCASGQSCPVGFTCVDLVLEAVGGGLCQVDADCSPDVCTGEDNSNPDNPIFGLCGRRPVGCSSDFACDISPCLVGVGCLAGQLCLPEADFTCADFPGRP